MKKISTPTLMRVIALTIIFTGVVLTATQFNRYRKAQDVLPQGSIWGGVDVGGLLIEDASERINIIYSQPIQLFYQGAVIQVEPEQIGLDVQAAVTASIKEIPHQGMWDFLWNKSVPAVEIPLNLDLDKNILRTFLVDNIASRYDQVPSMPMPVLNSTLFEIGELGRQLDIEASIDKISTSIQSLESRDIDLDVREMPAFSPDMKNLEVFLKQKIDQAGFNGIAEISLLDLKGDQSLHFAYRTGEALPVNIAFSAASTIKIPILVSILRRVPEPIPAEVDSFIKRMMVLSENPPADQLMDQVIGSDLAPMTITSDLEDLGLNNSFLAGYFYLGAPLLRVYETPANMRVDVSTSPDIYNQTTVGDMTILLQSVYQCAIENRGLLIETFPGEMTQAKCEYLLSVMAQNKIGVLFEAGVPEGTMVAHKHGWTEESDGYLHSLSDAGVIFGQDTDFVLVIFLYDPNQLLFTPANELMAQLTQVVYNYFNPNNQIDWIFGPIDYR